MRLSRRDSVRAHGVNWGGGGIVYWPAMMRAIASFGRVATAFQ